MRRILPNFFIIGAAKAATTSLSSLLALHHQAAIVQGKEPHFFSYEMRYRKGLDAYLKLFGHCGDQKAIGDASTSYSRLRYHPLTVSRIKEHVPAAKIIYMVRHPLKRMESAYVEHLRGRAGPVFTSINDAIKRQPMILDSSRYWEIFDAYRQTFGESSIRIVWFEEYVANPTAIFQDVCRFLEIEDGVVPNFAQERTNSRENTLAELKTSRVGETRPNTTWDEKLRQWVIDQIRDDNCRFLKHFGRPRNYWGDLF